MSASLKTYMVEGLENLVVTYPYGTCVLGRAAGLSIAANCVVGAQWLKVYGMAAVQQPHISVSGHMLRSLPPVLCPCGISAAISLSRNWACNHASGHNGR